MTTTITQVVSFILRHRRDTDAFKDTAPDVLYNFIASAMDGGCIVIDTDFFGCIRGVCAAVPSTDTKRLHIVGIISCSRGCTRKFAKWLLQQQSRDGWILTATRRGKKVTYNTPRLLNKLIGTH